jgi:hypothetical protein
MTPNQAIIIANPLDRLSIDAGPVYKTLIE